jgi:hypothetical protein
VNGRIKRLFDWRSWLVYSHRWMGIAGCVLFVAWFFSGIVMMYARMPTLAGEERLARAAALDLSTVTLSPADAAKIAGASGTTVQVAMFQDRPVYRFSGGGRNGRTSGGRVVFGDTGEVFKGIELDEAEAAARRFEPQHVGPLRHDGYLTEPDQWTLQARAQMPMHRFALDDEAGTKLYVSEVTGDVVLRTTAQERFWGYLGPVFHWVYFTPLRQNGPLWTEFVIWSSLIGSLMCASGLVWGLLRFSPTSRFRLKRVSAHSPYAGWMKWHHYAGLVFGLVSLTFVYSGLLSMGPFNWFQPVGGRARQQREAPGRQGQGLGAVSLERLRAAQAAMVRSFAPKSLEVMTFQGEMFWAADRAPALADADRWRSPSLMPRRPRPQLERLYVSVARPEAGTFRSFPREAMADIASTTMPGVPVEDEVWLDAFDGYYYDPSGTRPLPVLRVRYADPQRTWLYLDPARGAVVQRSEEITRLRRWLYQGLHSLDFPFLYYRRPLWDIVVIGLSIGGLVLSATTMMPAWRRLVRLTRRGVARVTRPRAAPRTGAIGAPATSLVSGLSSLVDERPKT